MRLLLAIARKSKIEFKKRELRDAKREWENGVVETKEAPVTSPGLANWGGHRRQRPVCGYRDSRPSWLLACFKMTTSFFIGFAEGYPEPVGLPLAFLPVAERDRDIRTTLYTPGGSKSKRHCGKFAEVECRFSRPSVPPPS